MSLIATDAQGNPYSLVISSADGSFTLTPVVNQSESTANLAISVNALSLISSALRLINVLAAGETIDTGTANDALMVLTQMIDGWNADGLAIFTTRADEYALVPGQQAYTLGPGGDFNSNRPSTINSISTIYIQNPDNPIEIPIPMYTVDEWQTKVPVKNVPGTFPLLCYDDGGFPLRTLNFWPIPQEADHVKIYSAQSLAWPASLQTLLSFPPGYAEAFRYNLAVRLAAEFAAQVPEVVQAVAVQSFARLKSANAPLLTLRSDLLSDADGYNYRADLFGLPY